MPNSRPLSGWISEHSAHTSGPADIAKPTMNTSSITTASSCWSVRGDAEVHDGADHAQAQCHHRKARVQDRLAAPAVDEADGDEGRQHVGQSDGGGEPHLRGDVVAHALEDARRVVHDHVDAGSCCTICSSTPRPDRATEVGVLQEHVPAMLRPAQLLVDIGRFAPHHLRIAAQLQQHVEGRVAAPTHQQPARAVGQREHADQEQDAGDRDHARASSASCRCS